MNTRKLPQEQNIIPFGAREVLRKLDEELALLREAMAKIDPNSKDPGDMWAIPIYQKIIARRENLARCLGSE